MRSFALGKLLYSSKEILFTFIIILYFSLFSFQVFAQWQPDVRLTINSAASYTSLNNAWCVAANGLVVHVVWYDLRDGNWEIYYKRSTDAGANWQADTRLTNNAAFSESPSITVSGSNVHVVFSDARDGNYEIYYMHSTDAGLSWFPDIRLVNNSAESSQPSITVSGTVVHITWIDLRDSNREIYYKRSTDGGMSWGVDIRMTNNSSNSFNPSVNVYGSVVHITWHDERDGNTEIYNKRSNDGGLSWSIDTRLTNNAASSEYPSIAVSGGFTHVVWRDTRDGNAEIYYKRSTDGGSSWETDTRLTNYTAISIYPSVTVSGSNIHVVWSDNRDGNFETYYKRSIDGGINWGPDERLTNNSAESHYPSIATSDMAIHVVWIDNRDSPNYETYFKHNPTGNPIGLTNISSEIPGKFSLGQNFPNPFNPITKIQFDISGTSTAQTLLSVYDILGREIETLLNEQLKPGAYEVDWDASSLSSGVYFYKIETDGFSDIKKMILIK